MEKPVSAKSCGFLAANQRKSAKICEKVRSESDFSLLSDSVKRHLRGRHLSVLNLKFDFISDGGCTREEQLHSH